MNTRALQLMPSVTGAAIALLDAVYLPLHISGVTFTTVVYGLPRVSAVILVRAQRCARILARLYSFRPQVGNQAFADYVDAHVSLTHINNEEDPVPILPGKLFSPVLAQNAVDIHT